MTTKLKQIAAAALALGMAGGAMALPSVTTAFTSGVQNSLSDDFNEVFVDRDGNGKISVGDWLLTSLAMTSYAPSATPATNVNELSVFSAIEIKSVAATTNNSCGFAPVLTAGCANFEMGAVTGGIGAAIAFYNAFVAPGAGMGAFTATNALGTTADSVALFIEDATPNFSLSSFGSGLDGDVKMVVDLVAANGDGWVATGPLKVSDFLLNTIGKGIGSFSMDGTISAQSFAGWNMGPDITGVGNLKRNIASSATPIGGDATFTLLMNRVPEPASLGLVGVALLGMGAAARRRKA